MRECDQRVVFHIPALWEAALASRDIPVPRAGFSEMLSNGLALFQLTKMGIIDINEDRIRHRQYCESLEKTSCI